MLFTWKWYNSCIVFNWWQVTTFTGFLFSCVAIMVISMGYESLKYHISQYTCGRRELVELGGTFSRRSMVIDSVGYAIQVGYSCIIMLVFMTYNGWYIISVMCGAGMGYYVWGSKIPGSTMAFSPSCH